MSRLRPFTYAASGPGQAQVQQQQFAPAQTQSKQIEALERDTDPSACALVNFIAKESIDASSQVRKDDGRRGGDVEVTIERGRVRPPTRLPCLSLSLSLPLSPSPSLPPPLPPPPPPPPSPPPPPPPSPSLPLSPPPIL